MPDTCQSLTIARTKRIAAPCSAIRAKRHVVDDDRIPDVWLIVDADRPVLLEVVARSRRQVVFRPAERVVERHRQPIIGPALLGRELQRMVVRPRDVPVDVGDSGVLRKRTQHLRNRAREVRVGEADAGHDRLCRRDIGGRGLLGQQVARERDISDRADSNRSRVRCLQENLRGCRRTMRRPSRCSEARTERRRSSSDSAASSADIGIAVRDAAARSAADHKAGVERGIEKWRRRHTPARRRSSYTPVRSSRSGSGSSRLPRAQQPVTVARPGTSAYGAAARVVDAIGRPQYGSLIQRVRETEPRPDGP